MPAEGLRKAVLERARAEAAEIEAAARARAEEIAAAARREAERAAAEIVERARREAAEARARAISAQERESRLAALEARNRLLDEAFEAAARRFEAAPAEELAALYRRELEGTELAGAVVKVPRGRSAEMERIVAGRARVEEDPAIDAGYIVVREDFRLDRTLSARLAEATGSLRAELARLLFGGAA